MAGIFAPKYSCHLWRIDRKSTRLNSSHSSISYAVFCLKIKTADQPLDELQHIAAEARIANIDCELLDPLFLFYVKPRPPPSTLFPYTTLFRSSVRRP